MLPQKASAAGKEVASVKRCQDTCNPGHFGPKTCLQGTFTLVLNCSDILAQVPKCLTRKTLQATQDQAMATMDGWNHSLLLPAQFAPWSELDNSLTWNFRSPEWNGPGTLVLWNIHSQESLLTSITIATFLANVSELMFTFAMSSPVCLSSVRFVHRTRWVILKSVRKHTATGLSHTIAGREDNAWTTTHTGTGVFALWQQLWNVLCSLLDNVNISGLEFGIGYQIVGSDEERALMKAV